MLFSFNIRIFFIRLFYIQYFIFNRSKACENPIFTRNFSPSWFDNFLSPLAMIRIFTREREKELVQIRNEQENFSNLDGIHLSKPRERSASNISSPNKQLVNRDLFYYKN